MPEQNKKKSQVITKEEQKNEQISESLISDKAINNTEKEIAEDENTFTNKKLYPSITVLLSKNSNLKISKQFINVLELVFMIKILICNVNIEYLKMHRSRKMFLKHKKKEKYT